MLISIINIGVYDTTKQFEQQTAEIRSYMNDQIKNQPDYIEPESGAFWNVNDRLKRKVHNDIDKGIRVVEIYNYPNAIYEHNCISGFSIDKKIELI